MAMAMAMADRLAAGGSGALPGSLLGALRCGAVRCGGWDGSGVDWSGLDSETQGVKRRSGQSSARLEGGAPGVTRESEARGCCRRRRGGCLRLRHATDNAPAASESPFEAQRRVNADGDGGCSVSGVGVNFEAGGGCKCGGDVAAGRGGGGWSVLSRLRTGGSQSVFKVSRPFVGQSVGHAVSHSVSD